MKQIELINNSITELSPVMLFEYTAIFQDNYTKWQIIFIDLKTQIKFTCYIWDCKLFLKIQELTRNYSVLKVWLYGGCLVHLSIIKEDQNDGL